MFLSQVLDRIQRAWVPTGYELRSVSAADEQRAFELDNAIRSLVEMLQLPWDPACLRFWESGRPVLRLPESRARKVDWDEFHDRIGRIEAAECRHRSAA